LALLWRLTNAQRILLFVDDLDRYEDRRDNGDQALLDSPEMQKRVQVLMLTDKTTFAPATSDAHNVRKWHSTAVPACP
jgi:hypothetical protein